ncbi:MAG TPA: peptidase [Flavobacteriales bacterium]|nr:peptidase [Flavobacteriales bacterium]
MNQFEQAQVDVGKLRPYILIGVGIILLLILISKSTVTIKTGYAGLYYYKFFGGIDPKDEPLEQGFHFIWPWDHVTIYAIRQQEKSETLTVLSSNLLDIKLDVTLFFQPFYKDLGLLEVNRGSNYVNDVVIPVMRSVAREVLAQYLPEEINTTKREAIEQEIKELMKVKLQGNYVQLNDILIRNITLPDKLRASIEKKLQQEQESLEYEFRLSKEKKEAERKRIEAEGIQNFQRIVTQSITRDLLKWKGIEATEKLSNSQNAKIVIVGNSEDGLPIILGDY